MDPTIVALLAQDGITNGAVYALLALALVLVFAVTRVIWIPSGEFLAYGTLTLAGLQQGKPPGTIGLLIGIAAVAGAMEVVACCAGGSAANPAAARRLDRESRSRSPRSARWLATPELPFWAQIAVTLALVTALGPMLYRVAYQPLAEASVLVLLIVSVGVHLALTGLGLWFFGAEGSRTQPFSSESFNVAGST
jgi:branched-chain amino acid transport system permease protein